MLTKYIKPNLLSNLFIGIDFNKLNHDELYESKGYSLNYYNI